MTIIEQCNFAQNVRAFLNRWGLKQKYVANICGISETTFSDFINGRVALSRGQLERVDCYMKDYINRNA